MSIGFALGITPKIQTVETYNYSVGVVNFDEDDAFDDFDTNFEYSAGVGLRWLSPVGMVRLDLAEPLSSDEDDLRVHFSFGPEL